MWSRPRSPSTINLNSSRSDKETIHLELSFDGAAPAYKPGDSLDLYAENDPAYVDALLQARGSADDAALRAGLHQDRDVTTLSLKTVETYAALRPTLRQGAAADGQGEGLDRRPPAHRLDRHISRSRSMPRSCAR